MNIHSLYEVRNRKVDGISPWFCVKGDSSWAIITNAWESYFRKNILNYCSNFNTVVVAGGCQGLYPRLLADIFKSVVTFEPNPINFYGLALNCQKENIIKFQCALGETPALGVNDFRKENLGENKVSETPDGNIPIIKLDSLGLRNVDLLILDVEGSELSALQGAKKLIEMWKPVLSIENSTPEIEEFLSALAYEIKSTNGLDTFFISRAAALPPVLSTKGHRWFHNPNKAGERLLIRPEQEPPMGWASGRGADLNLNKEKDRRFKHKPKEDSF